MPFHNLKIQQKNHINFPKKIPPSIKSTPFLLQDTKSRGNRFSVFGPEVPDYSVPPSLLRSRVSRGGLKVMVGTCPKGQFWRLLQVISTKNLLTIKNAAWEKSSPAHHTELCPLTKTCSAPSAFLPTSRARFNENPLRWCSSITNGAKWSVRYLRLRWHTANAKDSEVIKKVHGFWVIDLKNWNMSHSK